MRRSTLPQVVNYSAIVDAGVQIADADWRPTDRADHHLHIHPRRDCRYGDELQPRWAFFLVDPM